MSKFIYDYTGQKAIRIAHISMIRIVPGNLIPDEKLSRRSWNVECQLFNKTIFTLKTGLRTEQDALNWMKRLGFLK